MSVPRTPCPNGCEATRPASSGVNPDVTNSMSPSPSGRSTPRAPYRAPTRSQALRTIRVSTSERSRPLPTASTALSNVVTACEERGMLKPVRFNCT